MPNRCSIMVLFGLSFLAAFSVLLWEVASAVDDCRERERHDDPQGSGHDELGMESILHDHRKEEMQTTFGKSSTWEASYTKHRNTNLAWEEGMPAGAGAPAAFGAAGPNVSTAKGNAERIDVAYTCWDDPNHPPTSPKLSVRCEEVLVSLLSLGLFLNTEAEDAMTTQGPEVVGRGATKPRRGLATSKSPAAKSNIDQLSLALNQSRGITRRVRAVILANEICRTCLESELRKAAALRTPGKDEVGTGALLGPERGSFRTFALRHLDVEMESMDEHLGSTRAGGFGDLLKRSLFKPGALWKLFLPSFHPSRAERP